MKADIGVIFFLMISSPWDQPDNVGLVLVGMLVMAQEKQINIFISYFIKKFKSCFFWPDFLENIYEYDVYDNKGE